MRNVLAAVVERIEPRAGWSDLKLDRDKKAKLQEAVERLRRADRPGVTVLLTGPSGTGKTMAAEAMATAAGHDLYRVDLGLLVSKYIGETEKNINRLFDVAAGADVLLLFDEADSLFGKRTSVKDSHDRYANIDVGYLVQRLESFDGAVVLTVNRRQNLDSATDRLLTAVVEFP